MRGWVLTTRPVAQAAACEAAFAAAGLAGVNFPVLEIETVPAPALAALPLEAFALAFFVSPNALAAALAQRPHWPAELPVAGVGPGTEAALRAAGFATVIAPTADFDSEALLALPALAATRLAGRRVLVVQGEGGRALVAEALRERGALLEAVCVYRRRCAELDPAPLLARGAPAALVFTASEAVSCFLSLTGDAGRAWLRTQPVFASHPRILENLKTAGARDLRLAPPGNAALAAAVAKALGAGFG